MNKNTLTVIITLSILGIVGFYYYKYTFMESTPGENRFRLGNKYLEDGNYDEALQIFDEILAGNSQYKEAGPDSMRPRCTITEKHSNSTLNWPRALDGFGGFSEIFLTALQRSPIEQIIWKNS
jgi:tetratricopeptide (TPR) repeat protein